MDTYGIIRVIVRQTDDIFVIEIPNITEIAHMIPVLSAPSRN